MIAETVGRALARLKRLLCRHDDIFGRRPGRLYLVCIRCGRTTPGITVEGVRRG